MARLVEGIVRTVSTTGAVLSSGVVGVEVAQNNFGDFEKFLAITLILYTYGLIGPAAAKGLHGLGSLVFKQRNQN